MDVKYILNILYVCFINLRFNFCEVRLKEFLEEFGYLIKMELGDLKIYIFIFLIKVILNRFKINIEGNMFLGKFRIFISREFLLGFWYKGNDKVNMKYKILF